MSYNSGLERVTLVPDDSDDERRPGSRDSKRQDHYTSQRTSHERPSTSTSHQTSKSRGKKSVTYEEPSDFANLDEQAVPPPVENPDERTKFRRESDLEENIREARPSASRGRKSSERERRDSARRRRNVSQGQEELTEVEAPPPVPEISERRPHLEDEERAQRKAEAEPATKPTPAPASEEPYTRHQQKQPEDYLRKHPSAEVPQWLTLLYTVSYLIFFAIFGTLARLGTQWLTFYPGTPIVTPVIWANFGGSFIMGFLSEDQGLFRQDLTTTTGANGEKKSRTDEIGADLHATIKAEATKRKKAIPLYIGLATGFCGSYTSFSSFARDFFLALSNNLPTPIDHPHPGAPAPLTTSTVARNGGYSFEALIHVIMYTLALSIGGLIVGGQIAVFLDPYTPRIHGSFIRKFVDPGMVILAWGCWLGAVLLAIFPPVHGMRGEAVFALVFAPLGCLLRWYTSMKLNGLVAAFPLGTFAVNMFGTAVEGMCFDLQHVGSGLMGPPGGGTVGCQVLQGVMDGFCGCLTTVSTWVAEINGLRRKHAYAYAFASVLGGLCLMVVIMGSVRWSIGYSSPVCNTGYTDKIHG